MDKTQRGSVICSYNLRNTGAILFVNVPATIIRSACLGDARNIIPNRSISYRLTAACIISTAQQASPKVKGHSFSIGVREFTVGLVYLALGFRDFLSRRDDCLVVDTYKFRCNLVDKRLPRDTQPVH